MRELLAVNLLRLRRDKTFYFFAVLMAAAGLWFALKKLSQAQADGYGVDFDFTLSNIFFYYAFYIVVLAAILSSFFIGTEFSDGVIRNKLILGKSRLGIYCSNLITVIAANLLLCLVHIAATMVGISMGFSTPVGDVVLGVVCSAATVCTLCSIYTMVTMLCRQKTLAAVINTVFAFLSLFSAFYIRNRVLLARQAGEPDALNEFLYAFLPGCQMIQLWNDPEQVLETPPALLLLYALIVFAVTTAVGLYVFQKEDIR